MASDIPVPDPKKNEVLVRNEFTGVSFMDTHLRTGRYKAIHPLILGGEANGTVIESTHIGGGDLQADRVVYFTASGAYAQYNAMLASRTAHLPTGISTETAAATFAQGLSALTFARVVHGVRVGQWVLVQAATGGTGALLVQICVAIGARVIGTVSKQAKVDIALRHGAEFVITTSTADWVTRVKEITGDYGVDAVFFEAVGKDTFEETLRLQPGKERL